MRFTSDSPSPNPSPRELDPRTNGWKMRPFIDGIPMPVSSTRNPPRSKTIRTCPGRIVQRVAEQVGHGRAQEGRVAAFRVRPLIYQFEFEPLGADQRFPQLRLVPVRLRPGWLRRPPRFRSAPAARAAGMSGPDRSCPARPGRYHLLALAVMQLSFEHELTRCRNDHQRRAQFVTDIAGEEALPFDGSPKLTEGVVEGGSRVRSRHLHSPGPGPSWCQAGRCAGLVLRAGQLAP